METAAHMIVQGLVQGVGFRYFVQRKATAIGIVGYVRNQPGGAVEVLAEGPRSLVEALIKDIKVGPPMSSVRDLHVDWRPASGQYTTFAFRY